MDMAVSTISSLSESFLSASSGWGEEGKREEGMVVDIVEKTAAGNAGFEGRADHPVKMEPEGDGHESDVSDLTEEGDLEVHG